MADSEALHIIYKYTESQTRVRTLAATVNANTPVLDPADDRPAVTLTRSGDAVSTVTSATVPLGGGVTSISYANGGVGLVGKEVTLAYDGTFEFAGVVSTGVTPAPTSTAQGDPVYITSGGELTLSSSGNTIYGHVDYPLDYFKVAGTLPIRIGAV